MGVEQHSTIESIADDWEVLADRAGRARSTAPAGSPPGGARSAAASSRCLRYATAASSPPSCRSSARPGVSASRPTRRRRLLPQSGRPLRSRAPGRGLRNPSPLPQGALPRRHRPRAESAHRHGVLGGRTHRPAISVRTAANGFVLPRKTRARIEHIRRHGTLELDVSDGSDELRRKAPGNVRVEASGWKTSSAPRSSPTPPPISSTRTWRHGPRREECCASPSCASTDGRSPRTRPSGRRPERTTWKAVTTRRPEAIAGPRAPRPSDRVGARPRLPDHELLATRSPGSSSGQIR